MVRRRQERGPGRKNHVDGDERDDPGKGERVDGRRLDQHQPGADPQPIKHGQLGERGNQHDPRVDAQPGQVEEERVEDGKRHPGGELDERHFDEVVRAAGFGSGGGHVVGNLSFRAAVSVARNLALADRRFLSLQTPQASK